MKQRRISNRAVGKLYAKDVVMPLRKKFLILFVLSAELRYYLRVQTRSGSIGSLNVSTLMTPEQCSSWGVTTNVGRRDCHKTTARQWNYCFGQVSLDVCLLMLILLMLISMGKELRGI
jgi:hypothetical protein